VVEGFLSCSRCLPNVPHTITHTLALKLQARCGALVAVRVKSADSQDYQVVKSRLNSWDEVLSYDQGTISGNGTPHLFALNKL